MGFILRHQTLTNILLVTSLVFLIAGSINARPNTLNRNSIPDEYKWDLSDLYTDWEAWEAGLAELDTLMGEFPKLQGTLAQGPEQLLKAYKMNDDLNILAFKVYRYPDLMHYSDTRDNDINARLQQVQILFARFGLTIAWFNPELLAIPWETMKAWLDQTPDLAPYRYTIEDRYRQQEHVLDAEKEQLLSYYSRLTMAPYEAYSALSIADMKNPDITLASGEVVTLSRGAYRNIRVTNRNQDDRRLAFETHYQTYMDNINTYSSLYDAVLQANWATAQARNYSSCLEAFLNANNVPVSIYESLIATAKAGVAPMQRYYGIRQKALGLDTLQVYDCSIPLTDLDKTYEYDDAKKWIIEAVGLLGKDYQTKMKTTLSGGWIDVYENEGKWPGAFTAPVLGVHPYMLMNYTETMRDVFTVAHEAGHMLHSVLSDENQPLVNANPTIFVAEVASITTEALLLQYLLERTDDTKERILLLDRTINDLIGAFYGQVQFADFEYQAHQMVEQGQPITADILQQLYLGLEKEYSGDALAHNDLLGVLFARVTHFYQTPFYVYQYSTCYATSAMLVAEILSEDKKVSEAAVDRYLTLLKAGASDYPMELLKQAGVDLSKPEPVEAVVDRLDELVTLLEEELAKL